MQLRWTFPACEDLCRIAEQIQPDDPASAVQAATTWYDGCGSLRDFPHRGRVGRIGGTREMVFPGLPYLVVYRVTHQGVEVLRIYHEGPDWP